MSESFSQLLSQFVSVGKKERVTYRYAAHFSIYIIVPCCLCAKNNMLCTPNSKLLVQANMHKVYCSSKNAFPGSRANLKRQSVDRLVETDIK